MVGRRKEAKKGSDLDENWTLSLFLSIIFSFSSIEKLFARRCHRQFALFGFNQVTSVVQFETNSIYEFVPSSIYSRKKQMPVFKGQLFISI